ncbi:MAG TPA: YebC/PmpR family DNA-binding transcriptional regulator [Anaerolineae bacterium]|nr:YebC/PmpR family DNA-binding transcriptional regulator [Anaerolineae bacterium]
MSGHSHWATIKRKKGANDAKRGQMFSKLGREIAIAARDGADPENNVRLRLIVNKAKSAGMPKDMIERTIRRGAGLDKDAAAFEELMYEGYGPHGIAMLVKVTTDNRNRTVADLRRIFTRAGGSLAEAGAVAWNFEQKGYIAIPVKNPDPDKMFEMAVDAGADDVEITDEHVEIYTAPNELHAVSAALEKTGLKPETVELVMKPKQLSALDAKDAQTVLQVVDQLEDLEDVQQVYANLDIPEELMSEYAAQAA